MEIYGVVDIGTLKVKTEIASVKPNGALESIYTSNTLTRFGVDIDENEGSAKEENILATINELKRVKEEFTRFGVTHHRVVSTHAMRRAKNREEIIARIKKETGFEVENISQEEEARFFFRAVMHAFVPEDKEYAVIDVGGGSVQILVGTKSELRATHMMKTGTISMHEKVLTDPHNPESYTTPEDVEAIKEEIVRQLAPLEKKEGVPLIYGSSMIIDVMKALQIPLETHEDSVMHPYKTQATHLEEFVWKLQPLKFRERNEQYPLAHDYAWGVDVGFSNAVAVAEHLKSPYIIPSNANIAQGIIYAMADGE